MLQQQTAQGRRVKDEDGNDVVWAKKDIETERRTGTEERNGYRVEDSRALGDDEDFEAPTPKMPRRMLGTPAVPLADNVSMATTVHYDENALRSAFAAGARTAVLPPVDERQLRKET